MSGFEIDRFLKFNSYEDYFDEDAKFLDVKFDDLNNHFKILYKKSPHANIIKLYDPVQKMHYIIWDNSFWELFLKFLYVANEESFSINLDSQMILESSGYSLGIFNNYLSNKYEFISKISSRLKFAAHCYGYNVLCENLYENKGEKDYYRQMMIICKLFVLFHETSHIEFKRYENENLLQSCIDIFYSILDNKIELLMEMKDNGLFNSNQFYEQIKNHTLSDDLAEELAADARALGLVLECLGINDNCTNKDYITLALKSISILINFITYKSLLDKRWDYYIYKTFHEKEPTEENKQVLRAVVFPIFTIFNIGNTFLGESLPQKLFFTMDYLRILYEPLGWILDKDYIEQSEGDIHVFPPGVNCENMEKIANILDHMIFLSHQTSIKYIQYLFNLAHTAQHSPSPETAIPLFEMYIKSAVAKYGDNNNRYIADAYARMARVYAIIGKYSLAESNVSKAKTILDKQCIGDLSLSFIYNNIGNVFSVMKKYKDSVSYYKSSIDMRISNGDISSLALATSYLNLSTALCNSNLVHEAMIYILKAYKIIKCRFDRENDNFIFIRNEIIFYIDIFTVHLSNGKIMKRAVVETDKIALSEKQKMLIDNPYDLEIIEYYLLGIVNELQNVTVDEGIDLYIELLDLIVKNNYHYSLMLCSYMGFSNLRSLLINDLNILSEEKYSCDIAKNPPIGHHL